MDTVTWNLVFKYAMDYQIAPMMESKAQSNQIRQAVGDGNFEPSRLAQLADKLNNFRYELQLKLTDALTNQICSSKQKLDKPLFAFSFFQIKCDIFSKIKGSKTKFT